MGYLLSVDGGGTSTVFLVTDLNGNKKMQFSLPSTNYKVVGIKEMKKVFETAFKKIQIKLKINLTDIKLIVLGLSGMDTEEDEKLIEETLISIGIKRNQFKLINDAVIAYYAKSTNPGVVLISGTGSIVMAIDTDGNFERRGGWGSEYSDAGSGYWIGKKAIECYILNYDGALDDSKIFSIIETKTELEGYELVQYLLKIEKNYEVAKFAEYVIEAVEDDNLAKAIMEEASIIFSKLVVSCLNTLSKGNADVVFAGGVFNSSYYRNRIKDLLINSTDKKMEFLHNKDESVWGGINYARRSISK